MILASKGKYISVREPIVERTRNAGTAITSNKQSGYLI
ncbi:hypothetical protein HMPREF1142_0571 [Peptostreptococcaceae bacterium AS15]|nr:hypothetical protein HMPREF1142_0571 [Peptostreptococcaceae bacterium AS15]